MATPKTVNVFHDERRVGSWLYHGFLIVDANDGSLADLLNKVRRDIGYSKRIHFNELTAHSSTSRAAAVAKDWAKLFRENAHQRSCFHILGIDIKQIDRAIFDQKGIRSRAEEDTMMYLTFFKIGVYGAVRFFFEKQPVTISNIVTEKHSGREEKILTIPVEKLQESDGINLACSQITEIEHGYSAESDCVEYVDVILGAASQNLDRSSKSKTGCIEVAGVVRPVINRLVNRPYNRNSRYWRRYSLSFFPKKKLNLEEFKAGAQENQFYATRPLVPLEQLSLLEE